MILDVACGAFPYGDINLDLGPVCLASDSGPFTKANIYASVYDLPFEDNSIEVIHFVGILHHLKEPKKAWDEMVRVCKDIIIGEEPSVFNYKAHLDKHHVVHGYTLGQLYRICRSRNMPYVRIGMYFPSFIMPNYHILGIKRDIDSLQF